MSDDGIADLDQGLDTLSLSHWWDSHIIKELLRYCLVNYTRSQFDVRRHSNSCWAVHWSSRHTHTAWRRAPSQRVTGHCGTSDTMRLMRTCLLEERYAPLVRLLVVASLWTCRVKGFCYDSGLLAACLHVMMTRCTINTCTEDMYQVFSLSRKLRVWYEEVALNVAAYLLTRSDSPHTGPDQREQLIHEAQKVLKLRVFYPSNRSLSKTGRQVTAETLKALYLGLIEYSEWRRQRAACGPHADSYTLSQCAHRARRAIYLMEPGVLAGGGVSGRAGPWQAYVPQYVELCAYTGQLERAAPVLQHYCRQHSDNYQVLLTLYQYMSHQKERDDSSEDAPPETQPVATHTLISILHRIVNICPSHAAAVTTLCRMRHAAAAVSSGGAGYDECVAPLCRVLEFAQHRRDVALWTLLAKHLVIARRSGCATQCHIDTAWWARYHFDIDTTWDMCNEQQQNLPDRTLTLNKCIVAIFLLGGPDNPYTQHCLTHMATAEDRRVIEQAINVYTRC